MTDTRVKILMTLFEAGYDGMKKAAIHDALSNSKNDSKKINRIIDQEINAGIVGSKKDKYFLRNTKNFFIGKVTRAAKTHGFVLNEANSEEAFVRGRDLIGAIPGDKVLAKITELKDENNRSDTAKIVAVIEETESILTGVIVEYEGQLRVAPSAFATQTPLVIVRRNNNDIKIGDKVRIAIAKRSDRHSDHIAEIISVYGNADSAKVSTYAYLEEKCIATDFPEDVVAEAEKSIDKRISATEIAKRTDLRDKKIFTIDGADTKDIDDAISIERTKTGYKLGVHIADVSHYVKKNSAIEREAFQRGTSIYIADRVIPMLPKELSNGICSLNPNVDRLAFTCMMNINKEGEITKFQFMKTVIRSRVQGVYSEINAIIDGSASKEIKAKYKEVSRMIPIMTELADILMKKRSERGSPEINTSESKIICDENGVCVDIKKRERGISECVIEEFMLAANNAAAKVGMENDIPFVYRIHENPSVEKLASLQETLVKLGINAVGINANSSAQNLSDVLIDAEKSPRFEVINKLVLRTMMKAKYSETPVGHFGLVMKEYAHFTSPIRRYADLSIHRILTDYVYGLETKKLVRKYKKYSVEAAARASSTELVSVSAERDCEKYYAAEFMKNHVGEEFDGIISGVIQSGIFVQLDNTVEGRIDTYSLPEGAYEVADNIALIETLSNTVYTIGDKLRVKCVAANVAIGLIDFQLIEKYHDEIVEKE